MKSIKPGRGPSMMGGIVGIFTILIGIGWTVMAAQIHWLMALFGLCWTAIAVMNTVYHFKNAKSKHRYSTYDIVDSTEEPDPLNQRFSTGPVNEDARFCPYCGSPAQPDYDFCSACGRRLPE